LKNKAFRRWFHKVYKRDQKTTCDGPNGRKNPDLGDDDIKDAWDEWNQNGKPDAD